MFYDEEGYFKEKLLLWRQVPFEHFFHVNLHFLPFHSDWVTLDKSLRCWTPNAVFYPPLMSSMILNGNCDTVSLLISWHNINLNMLIIGQDHFGQTTSILNYPERWSVFPESFFLQPATWLETLKLQLWTKCLRQTLVFMWNCALQENFSSFSLVTTKFLVCEEDWPLDYIYKVLRFSWSFLIS